MIQRDIEGTRYIITFKGDKNEERCLVTIVEPLSDDFWADCKVIKQKAFNFNYIKVAERFKFLDTWTFGTTSKLIPFSGTTYQKLGVISTR